MFLVHGNSLHVLARAASRCPGKAAASMYNGVGLQSVRGTATNGYVQRNLAHVKPRTKVDYNKELEKALAKPSLGSGARSGFENALRDGAAVLSPTQWALRFHPAWPLVCVLLRHAWALCFFLRKSY